MKEFLLFFSIMGIARTDPNCMVFKAFNYFGSPTWYTNPSACFTHLMDSVNNLNIYYTNQSIIGLAFDGTNFLLMEPIRVIFSITLLLMLKTVLI
jgi:hypothetical protein